MNYRHLEIFVMVLGTGSVTQAAERLGLTQPAISKSLKILEGELGVRLFERASRSLRPTDEGRALFLEASRLIDNYEHVESFAQNLAQMEHARLEISCIPAIAIDWMPRNLGTFVQDYPEARLCFRSRSSPETMQLVARGEVDLGVAQVREDDSSVEKTHLFDLPAVCIIPRGHPLALNDTIALKDLHGERILSLSGPDTIRREFEAQMQMAGCSIASRIEIASGAMLTRTSAYSGIIAVVDVESAQLHDPNRSVVRPFRRSLGVPIYLLHNARKPPTLMLRKFSSHLLKAGIGGSLVTIRNGVAYEGRGPAVPENM